MLLEYGLRNYLSFKEGASVSFRLDGNVPERMSLGLPFATLMCVKGANGSGKTHLLKALAFVASFAAHSFETNPSAEIPVEPFFASSEPSSFYVDFSLEGVTYTYELEVTSTGVVREALFKTKQRKTLLFERDQEVVRAGGARLKTLESMKVRRNASVIATAYHHQIDDLLPVYRFFDNFRFNVNSSGVREAAIVDIYAVSQIMNEHEAVREHVEKFLQTCDIGITRLQIASEEGSDGKRRFFPVFIHDVDGIERAVPAATESQGTKQIVRLLLPIFTASATGSVLILDELDLYIHPHLLPTLLAPFLIPRGASEPAGQLLFSTHQSEVMDLCGRYRTTLVNKENNQSFAYRLDEVPGDVIRNDRTLVTPYNDRKIGGVPRL
jgi:AAA15 family ATPase/GTPase